jgi:hypothetical protein
MTVSPTSPLLPPATVKNYGSTTRPAEAEQDPQRGERALDEEEQAGVIKGDEAAPEKKSKPFREMALLCFGLWTR